MKFQEEYIEQCRKAVEIQALWCPKEGDWFFDGGILFLFSWGTTQKQLQKKSHITWIPLQHQLQEVVKYNLKLYSDKGLISLLHIFTDEMLSKNYTLKTVRNMSMEQLWLAFVMHNNFQKTWNGKDWVK